jgi:CBS domain-containing protein
MEGEDDMLVRDIMTKNVDVIEDTQPLTAIAQVMRDEDIGAVPVRNGDKLVGMVTDRDIVVRAIARGQSVDNLLARDAMSDRILYCREDWSADEAAENMAQNRIRRLPVVDDEKNLVGIVSLGDVTKGAD